MPLDLTCHSDFLAAAIKKVQTEVSLDQNQILNIKYSVFGEIDSLKLLDISDPKRTDYLWQTTCFEAFIGIVGEDNYLEVNLSPCTEWAVYSFNSHRKGMKNPDLKMDPKITTSVTGNVYALQATLDLTGLLTAQTDQQLEMSLTAVIEEQDGRKSLWALAHPSGNPDFHNRDCFVHQLEAS